MKSLCWWLVGANTDDVLWVADLFEGDTPIKWCGDGTNYEGKCTNKEDAESQVKALALGLGVEDILYDGDSTECFADC